MSEASPRGVIGGIPLAAFGAVLLALTLAGLALHVPGADTVGSIALTNVFVALMAVAGLVYLGAVRSVLRHAPTRGAAWVVIAVALAMRVPVLIAPPFLSSDVYRYVWDGRVQAAGINPYRYIPDDPALQGLRDAAIYPHVNRRDYAPTIYPPAAQVIFAAIARVAQTPFAVKAAMMLFECVAMAAVLRLLDLAGLPRARLLIYAWNPLAVWSFAGNGHVDAAVIGLVALALLARGLRHQGWAGAALGAAVLVKFLPVVLAPALWRRRNWRLPVAGAAVIVTLYACYADAGWRVLGFLQGYAGEEGIGGGDGLWLLAGLGKLGRLPSFAAPLYLALTAAGVAALGAWIAFRRRPTLDPGGDIVRVCGDAAVLAACLLAAISPHYSWYFPWLALPCCLCAISSVVYLSVAPLLLQIDPLHDRFLWPSLIYVPAIALAALDLRRRMAARSPVSMRTAERSL